MKISGTQFRCEVRGMPWTINFARPGSLLLMPERSLTPMHELRATFQPTSENVQFFSETAGIPIQKSDAWNSAARGGVKRINRL